MRLYPTDEGWGVILQMPPHIFLPCVTNDAIKATGDPYPHCSPPERHPLGKDKEISAKLKAELGVTQVSPTTGATEHVLHYALDTTTSRLSIPETVTLCSVPPPARGGQPGNSLRLSVRPKCTGTYLATVLLSGAWDSRVVAVEVTAQSTAQVFTLELECPARQTLSQEVPLVNKTDAAITAVATLTGRAFSGAKEVQVPAGESSARRAAAASVQSRPCLRGS